MTNSPEPGKVNSPEPGKVNSPEPDKVNSPEPDNVESEHPFAPFVRILGKGKSGTRSLDFDEARAAFGMILRGEVEDLQLGAFLMLLRVKEETGDELAGFVQACRDHVGEPPAAAVDLDWSSYAGKRSQHPWFLLSALLLADNGVRVIMHGTDGHTPGRAYSEQTLADLGVGAAADIADACGRLENTGFAFLPLRNFCAPLHDIVQLKPVLGLRSPVNTLARMLNPLRAPYSIQSVFHPNYAALHLAADERLAQPHSLVFKGDGGEVEIKPHARTECHLQREGQRELLAWPRQLEGRQEAASDPGPAALQALWRGQASDRYGENAVIESAAVALYLMQRADSADAARTLATDWWQQRDPGRL